MCWTGCIETCIVRLENTRVITICTMIICWDTCFTILITLQASIGWSFKSESIKTRCTNWRARTRRTLTHWLSTYNTSEIWILFIVSGWTWISTCFGRALDQEKESWITLCTKCGAWTELAIIRTRLTYFIRLINPYSCCSTWCSTCLFTGCEIIISSTSLAVIVSSCCAFCTGVLAFLTFWIKSVIIISIITFTYITTQSSVILVTTISTLTCRRSTTLLARIMTGRTEFIIRFREKSVSTDTIGTRLTKSICGRIKCSIISTDTISTIGPVGAWITWGMALWALFSIRYIIIISSWANTEMISIISLSEFSSIASFANRTCLTSTTCIMASSA